MFPSRSVTLKSPIVAGFFSSFTTGASSVVAGSPGRGVVSREQARAATRMAEVAARTTRRWRGGICTPHRSRRPPRAVESRPIGKPIVSAAGPAAGVVAACAAGGGDVRLQHVVHHHPIGAESPAERADRALHRARSSRAAIRRDRDRSRAGSPRRAGRDSSASPSRTSWTSTFVWVSPAPIANPFWPS